MHLLGGPGPALGLAEAVANISECERGRLHVDEDFAAVEFVPEQTGRRHRIVGCNFTNLATPLLRYDTGDLAVLDDDGCDCGRPGRVVASVDGRQEDLSNSVRTWRRTSASCCARWSSG